MSWPQSTQLERSTNQTARALALWQMQQKGLIDLSYGNKTELATKLGVSRWTLDRTLEVLNQAKVLARELELAMLSDQRLQEMLHTPAMSVGEEEYQQALKSAGLAA